ncbi:MAG TPA: pyridoxamine 5'-phosphate oxidase family protein [Mycobacteriales bacterium]|nr:pyridoxamine 5'-phosphate oxidase family protein [Mycobacteriales bacterium]
MEFGAFLGEPGRMAQVAAVSPRGVPLLGSVWFLYADGRFWFSSHPGTPFAAAALRSAEVAVLVDQFEPPDTIRQVRVRGRSRVEDPDPDRVHAIYARYLGADAAAWPAFFRARATDPTWTLWSVPPDFRRRHREPRLPPDRNPLDPHRG